MAELDKLIRINIDYENSLVKINEVEVALTDLAKAESLLTKTLITSSESRVRSEAQIQKEINALKQEQKSVAETTVQYGQFTAEIQQLELELGVLRGTAIRTADGIVTLKDMSEKAALSQKELAKQTALAQKEAAAQAEQARISQEKLNNTFIVANKEVMPQSINALRDQIRFTEQLRLGVNRTSFEYVQHTRTLQRLNKELAMFEGKNSAVSSGFNRLKNNSGLAAQTLVEVGRTVSDANYGFTAIANNLSQLSYYFVTLVKDSDGVKGAFKNLGRQLIGAGGVVIAIQLVITLIERYTLKQKEANKATDEFSKSMAGATGSIKMMENYAKILKDTNSTVEEQQIALSKLKKEGYDKLTGSVEQFLEAKKRLMVFEIKEKLIKDEAQKLIEEQVELQEKLTEVENQRALRTIQITGKTNLTQQQKSNDLLYATNEAQEKSKKIKEEIAALDTKIGVLMNKSAYDAGKLGEGLAGNPFLQDLLGEDDKTKEVADKRLAIFKQNLFDLSSEIEKFRKDSLKDANMTFIEVVEQERGFAIAALEVKKKQFADEEILRKENYVKQLDEKKTQAQKDNKWTEEDEANYKRLILEADETLKGELLEAEAEFNDAMLMLDEAFNTQLRIQNDKQLQDGFDAFRVSRDATILAQQKFEEQSERTEVGRLRKQEEHRQENFEREKRYLEEEIALKKSQGEITVALQEDLNRLEIENTQKTEDAKIAIRKAALMRIADNIDKTKEYVQALADFIDADFEAQKQKEENKTNAANNELRARLSNENLSKEEKENINQQIAANDEKLRLKQEEIDRKRFKTDKAFRISMALMDTASAALKAYVSQLNFDPTSPIRAALAAAAATALGLAQVAMISKQQFQTSASATPPSVSTGTGAGEGAATQAPDFNVVGNSNVNQLAQLVQAQLDKPFKTYVVAKDVTTAQELERNRVSAATI
jgi:hypothetical protein